MSRYDEETQSRSPKRRDKGFRRHDSGSDREKDYTHQSRSRKYRDDDEEEEKRPRKRRSLSPHINDSSSRQDRKHYRDRSPRGSHHRAHHPYSRSRSPPSKALQRTRAPLPSQDAAFTKEQNPDSDARVTEKQRPNFKPTGLLAAASNTVQTANQTIILKYHEPPESRKPAAKDNWRMYVFKNDEIVDTIELAEQSCWLFGREFAVADVPIEHPSTSKQHAVVQFRFIEKRNEFGDKVGKVKPYVLDLESANGTFVNGDRIEEGRYFELRDKDVVKFGHSRREYVVQLPQS